MTWLKLTRRVLRRIAWSLRAELYQAYRARIVSSELQTKSAGLRSEDLEHCARNNDALPRDPFGRLKTRCVSSGVGLAS